MTRNLLLSLALVLFAAGASSCRTVHLGAHHGDAHRAAFAEQAARVEEPQAPLDAADAEQVLQRRRTDGPPPDTAPLVPGALP